MSTHSPDFSQATKDKLCKRAASVCSNPGCRQLTTGPHTEPNKVVNVGEAAHIKGARVGAKRFDPEMNNVARSEITNGIWLCSKCAKEIDSDELEYSTEVLYTWKRQHEEMIKSGVNGSGWVTLANDKRLRQFQDETDSVQQIILDRPTNWRWLLLVEMLGSKLGKVKKEYEALKNNITYQSSKYLPKVEVVHWLEVKTTDLSNIVHMFDELINLELARAIASSNAGEIKYVTDKILEASQGLLEWDKDIRFTIFPSEITSLKEKMLGWGEVYVNEVFRIKEELSKILEQEDYSKPFLIQLVFEPPKELHNIIPYIRKGLGI